MLKVFIFVYMDCIRHLTSGRNVEKKKDDGGVFCVAAMTLWKRDYFIAISW